MRQIPTSSTLTRCWTPTQLLIISILRMACCAIWTIFVFHQASERRLFGNPTLVEWQDTLAWKIQWKCCNDISTGCNFDMMSTSISGPALPMLLPNQPSRNKACTLLFLILMGPCNPYQWTTCWYSLPPGGEMNVFLWLLIAFPRWRFWPHARRASRRRALPIFSLNECGYTLGSHKPLSHIDIVDSSTHFGRASGHIWTRSSPSPLPSTPK
jgi:hypothetical protein